MVVEQKGADAYDGSGQITGPGNALFNFIGSFTDQDSQLIKVDLHLLFSKNALCALHARIKDCVQALLEGLVLDLDDLEFRSATGSCKGDSVTLF